MKMEWKSPNTLRAVGCLLIITIAASFPSSVFAESTILKNILSGLGEGTDVEAFVPCYLEIYTRGICAVTDKVVVENGTKFHKRSLLVYDARGDSPRKVFQYDQEEYSGIMSIDSIDRYTIAAIWATGSAMVLTVFRVIGKDIKLVLEAGTKFSPEMIDLDGDGVKEVLITEGEWSFDKKRGKRVFRPAKTSIYTLQKDKYVEIKAIPYKDRFLALRKR